MSKRVVALKAGEYKSCGVSLHIQESSGGGVVIQIVEKDKPTLIWSFSGEGVFEGLGAESSREPQETTLAYLACEHVAEGTVEGVVLRGVGKEGESGWLSCTKCIRQMLSGDAFHVIDREVADHVLAGVEVLEVSSERAKGGVSSQGSSPKME